MKDIFPIYNYLYPFTIIKIGEHSPNASNALPISIMFSFYFPFLFNLSWGSLEAYYQCGTRVINAWRPMPSGSFWLKKVNASSVIIYFWCLSCFPLKKVWTQSHTLRRKNLAANKNLSTCLLTCWTPQF